MYSAIEKILIKNNIKFKDVALTLINPFRFREKIRYRSESKQKSDVSNLAD